MIGSKLLFWESENFLFRQASLIG